MYTWHVKLMVCFSFLSFSATIPLWVVGHSAIIPKRITLCSQLSQMQSIHGLLYQAALSDILALLPFSFLLFLYSCKSILCYQSLNFFIKFNFFKQYFWYSVKILIWNRQKSYCMKSLSQFFRFLNIDLFWYFVRE